ncbi:BamA/TamA family outer membrane protein [Cyclobacterium plantarum]|uniref:BamA/TamA family outer membrane protein n=1 Tax=Cyclobacterium plantarum TaxID=2716263 RepID=UPI003F72AF1B
MPTGKIIGERVNIPGLLLLLLFPSFLCFGQEERNDSTVFKALPLAYYTPETRIAFEGFAFYSYYSEGSRRKSNVRLFATYTQNRQYLFILPWQIYTANDQFFLNGSLDYRKFPEYYYGIGNDTQEKNRALYEFSAFTINSKSYLKLENDTYMGISLQGQWLLPEFPENEPLFDDINITNGRRGYNYLSLGPSFMWDRRDHILSPSEGSFLEFTPTFGFGQSDQEPIYFGLASLDIRDYWKLSENSTWANQFVAQFSMGQVPYRVLPTLGGPFLHRGYYQGRFRDRHLMILQSEFRQHIIGRFGIVAFASAGRVYSNVSNDLVKDIHLAAGGGLRFRISKNDRTNVRFDYSFTPDSNGFYIYFAESF